MDTSEQYIKMCEQAGEIQKGRFYPCTSNMGKEPMYQGNNVFMEIGAGSTSWRTIWLPRQDQLQEMVYGKNTQDVNQKWIVRQFYQFCYDDHKEYTRQFSSMEQLWLAFVMKEKFGKVWNGEEWIMGADREQGNEAKPNL